MFKIVRLPLLSVILAIFITAGTYYISRNTHITFSHSFGACAQVPAPAEPALIQNETSRGFPAPYEKTIPSQVNSGLCGMQLLFTHTFDYANMIVDFVVWGALILIILNVSSFNKK